MTKILVRGGTAPEDAVVLSDSEFIDACYDTINERVEALKNQTESAHILDALSDILELSNSILQKENISATALFAHASTRRQEEGTFLDKKAIEK